MLFKDRRLLKEEIFSYNMEKASGEKRPDVFQKYTATQNNTTESWKSWEQDSRVVFCFEWGSIA